jgi:hypothetical protein
LLGAHDGDVIYGHNRETMFGTEFNNASPSRHGAVGIH